MIASSALDFEDLARKTQNYTGAEIEAVVKSALSFAIMASFQNGEDTAKSPCRVGKEDFEAALQEVNPRFGSKRQSQWERYWPLGLRKVPQLDATAEHVQTLIRNFLSRNARAASSSSGRSASLRVLLHGPCGSGKTAMAAAIAVQSGISFARVISPEDLVGLSEQGAADALVRTFLDAHRSPESLIVLDHLEALFQYAAIGPRYSNQLLQTILGLLIRPAPEGRKAIVLATTSNYEASRDVPWGVFFF
jgi:vesicle-fusing ATPase